MKVMIHAVPKRLWYVENYLIPSIDGDVSVWVDDKGLGNLQSCMAAFASCKGGETWHLQDDVLLCRDFEERTEGLEGVVFGFCCEQFEDDPALVGRVYMPDAWHSFQCVKIPDEYAQDCARWFYSGEWDSAELYALKKANVGDDSFFREYLLSKHGRETAYNISLVEHVDRIIGGSVANEWRGWWARSSLWDDEALVEDLIERLRKDGYK